VRVLHQLGRGENLRAGGNALAAEEEVVAPGKEVLNFAQVSFFCPQDVTNKDIHVGGRMTSIFGLKIW
jgi:hypothetical protein